jgi:hypothetical protein
LVEVDRQSVDSAEAAANAVTQPRVNGHLLRVVGEHGVRFVTVPMA